MIDEDKATPSPAMRRGGALTLYILAAALAAIAGFAAISFLARPGGQEAKLVPAQNVAPDAGEAETSNGLERLVRVTPPNALSGVVFRDGEGRERNLGEWRGKVVLVNLWATWCAPCKREMPSLDRLQAKLGNADFTVLPISLDRTGPDKPRQFIASNGLKHLDLFLDSGNALMQTLRAPGLPLSVLIDRQGREIARLAGPAEWDSAEAEAMIRAAIGKAGDG
jgi:thiol-disulfide isomerase/thioredoxin